jgi:hypothetical protein
LSNTVQYSDPEFSTSGWPTIHPESSGATSAARAFIVNLGAIARLVIVSAVLTMGIRIDQGFPFAASKLKLHNCAAHDIKANGQRLR